MSKNIVVIVGSPRDRGNTELMAETFARGARESGNNVTIFKLNKVKVNSCLHCEYCWSHPGTCAQKDGMQEIYPALYQADILVLASPLYFYSFSSQIKASIDRLYATLSKPLQIKACALLADCYDDDIAVCEPLIVNYKTICKYMNWEELGMVLLTGNKSKGAIITHPRLSEVEEFGRSIS